MVYPGFFMGGGRASASENQKQAATDKRGKKYLARRHLWYAAGPTLS